MLSTPTAHAAHAGFGLAFGGCRSKRPMLPTSVSVWPLATHAAHVGFGLAFGGPCCPRRFRFGLWRPVRGHSFNDRVLYWEFFVLSFQAKSYQSFSTLAQQRVDSWLAWQISGCVILRLDNLYL